MNTVFSDLQQRADEGDVEAQYALALKLYKGGPGPADPRSAYRMMKLSAENGCLKAQKALGLLYSSSQYAPFPEENAREAFRMYQMAAQQGDAQAAYWVGRCYMVGYGTEMSEELGRKWIGEARSHGFDEDEDYSDAVVHTESEVSHTWEFETAHTEHKIVQAGEEQSSALGEAENSERVRTSENSYLRSGFIFAGVGFGIGLVITAVVHLFFMILSGKTMLYGVVMLVALLLGTVFGFIYGYKIARQRAQDREYFRSTPYYAQCQKDYENLDRSGKNTYELYARLYKIMVPLGYGSRPLGKSCFGSVRGYMIPSLYLPLDDSMQKIDLLVLTEKAIFFITVSGVTGSVSGNAIEEEWCVRGLSGAVRYLRNPMLKNEQDVQAFRAAMKAAYPGQDLLSEIPIYSMVCFSNKTSVKEVEGADPERYQYVLSGDGEKIRSFIEMRDSRHVLHHEEMTLVMKMLQEQLKKQPDYRSQQ